MKISAVICEYNPFHNGHKLQIEQMRLKGATHVIAIMSGNFVQRGEPAIIPKEYRAKAALLNGADLVVELPLPYATSTADRFAFGGVEVVKAFGCVDFLGFGAECDDVTLLKETADLICSPNFSENIKIELGKGITFATARQKALNSMGYPVHSSILSTPNNILAVEYIKHLKGSNIEPLAIKRIGAGHHSNEIFGATASARYVRENWLSDDVFNIVPDSAQEIYLDVINKGYYFSDKQLYSRIILSKLRFMNINDLANISDISEGLEFKLHSAIKSATNLADLYCLVKSKRYTMARVRRLVLSSFLNIKAEENTNPPKYIRILAMNKKGEEILSIGRDKSSLPISHSLAKIAAKNPELKEVINRDACATDLYNLILNNPLPCSTDYTNKIIKNNVQEI